MIPCNIKSLHSKRGSLRVKANLFCLPGGRLGSLALPTRTSLHPSIKLLL